MVPLLNNQLSSPLINKCDQTSRNGITPSSKRCEVFKGLLHSQAIRVSLLGIIGFTALALLFTNPFGWTAVGAIIGLKVATVVGVGFFGVKSLCFLSGLFLTDREKNGGCLGSLAKSWVGGAARKSYQKTKVEFSVIGRNQNTRKGKAYHEICDVNGAKLFLGHLPNRWNNELEQFREAHSSFYRTHIISINEPWELNESRGMQIRYLDNDLPNGFKRSIYQSEDHVPLTYDNLVSIADEISQYLAEGKHVYVHCLAGKGRSAMGIAAYLIKKHIDEAGDISSLINEEQLKDCVNWITGRGKPGEEGYIEGMIRSKRPCSTIYKLEKREQLYAFARRLVEEKRDDSNKKTNVFFAFYSTFRDLLF